MTGNFVAIRRFHQSVGNTSTVLCFVSGQLLGHISLLGQHLASPFEKISASKIAQIDTKHHFESNFPFRSAHFPYLVFLVSEKAQFSAC